MLLLGRDVDSHFVFQLFFSPLTCQKKQHLGLSSAHTCGWCWEPPVLQLPAPTLMLSWAPQLQAQG